MIRIGDFYFSENHSHWMDRDGWSAFPQDFKVGVCGTPILTHIGKGRGGRPVTLKITGITRRRVEELRTMTNTHFGSTFTLEIPADDIYTTAIFRAEDGSSPLEAVPVADVDEKLIPLDLPAFTITVKMRDVGEVKGGGIPDDATYPGGPSWPGSADLTEILHRLDLLEQGGAGGDGRTVLLRKTDTHIQWQHEGDAAWQNLVALSEITPEPVPGDPGPGVAMQKTATHLQWKRDNEIEWRNLLDLSELPSGGGSGERVDFRVEGDYVQWKHESDTAWVNLIPLSAITPEPLPGIPGPAPELRVTDTYIQWRVAGDDLWSDLLALEDIGGGGSAPAVSLDGPVQVNPGETVTWTIVNYSAFSTYTASATAGVASVSGNTVTLVIPAGQPEDIVLTVSCDGRATSFTLDVLERLIHAPTLSIQGGLTEDLGAEIILLSSAFSAYPADTYTHSGSTWRVWNTTTGSDVLHTESLADAANLLSFGVTLPLASTFRAELIHHGGGMASATDTLTFSTVTATLATPEITSPAQGQTDVSTSLTIQATAFGATPSGIDTQRARSWQLARDAGFTDIVKESLEDTVNLKDWPVTGLPSGETLYAKVKDHGHTLGDTVWSAARQFVTVNISIQKPAIITPVPGTEDIAPNVVFEAHTFTPVPAGSDTHRATSWWAWTSFSMDPATLVASSLEDETNLLSWPVEDLPEGDLFVACQFHGNATDSVVSDPAQYTVACDIVNLVLVDDTVSGGDWRYVNNLWNEISAPLKGFFDTHPVWGQIKDVIIDGQHMVQIPAFFCAVQEVPSGPFAGKKVWRLSATEQLGLTRHSAFWWGGNPLNQFWFGKYAASLAGGKLQSLPGVMPAVSRTIVQFSADAEARNVGGVAGFMQNSYHQNSAIQWLYLLENATMDAQAKTGRGRVNTSSAALVDAPDVAQATYRGMVGLWGNVYQWAVGMQIEAGRVWVWDNNQQLVNTGHTIPNLAAEWRHPKTFATGAGTGFDLGHGFIAATNQTASEGATCQDGHYFTTSTARVMLLGGAWNNGSFAGLWCAVGNDSSGVASTVGSRLAKV